MSNPPKPDVAIAVLCERPLIERDNVLSLIRLVDTFRVAMPPDLAPGAQPQVVATLVIGLKSYELDGDFEVIATMHGPTKANDPIKIPFQFAKDGTGSVTVTQVVIGVKNFGPCRIDLDWYGERLTSVPFRLQQIQTDQSDPSQSPSTTQP